MFNVFVSISFWPQQYIFICLWFQKSAAFKGKDELQSQSQAVFDKNTPRANININSTQREDSRNAYANRSSTAAKYISGKNKSQLTPTEPRSHLKSTDSTTINAYTEGVDTDTAGSRWDYFKSSFQDLKFSLAGKRFAPLRQFDESHPPKPQSSSSETLDYIFENLRRKPSDRDLDDGTMDLNLLDSSTSK